MGSLFANNPDVEVIGTAALMPVFSREADRTRSAGRGGTQARPLTRYAGGRR
ncbi:hypothetical protein [Phytoactinopolyspora mesophila]|uniref:Uncharacterized protein n=1 Tax=Phytoactinopolyspora mesophila TaxID=2650750 RepID=A0A7K3M6J7_9ACTN|nr:hypothetical protein [Phytoactinopolyspora mesophila]NDL58943.1 hypothetical protein [Phytoactinopolyspora mesophila]